MGVSLAKSMPNYSEGGFTGRVVRFSEQGFFWKTWEGELLCEGLTQRTDMDSGGNLHSSSAANIKRFSLDAKRGKDENIDELVKNCQNALTSGNSITLAYRVPWVGFPCQGDTSRFVHQAAIATSNK